MDVDRLYERVLVLRCQAGDEAAFAELVGRYAPRLRTFLSRMLDDFDAADTNRDSFLSKDELAAAAEARRNRFRQRFE